MNDVIRTSNELADKALALAVLFHDTYERLAPKYGYETRQDTKRFDPVTPNGQLMVAVCLDLLSQERLWSGSSETSEQLTHCELSLHEFDPGQTSEYWLRYAEQPEDTQKACEGPLRASPMIGNCPEDEV